MEFAKIKSVMVLTEGGSGVSLSGGVKVVAGLPPIPGDDTWGAIDQNGRFTRVRGKRISGQGIEKALALTGYQTVEPDHPLALRLLEEMGARSTVKMVEQASRDHAAAMQQEWAGKRIKVVPFDASKPITEAIVKDTTSLMCTLLGMGVGLTSGMLQVAYRPEDKGLRTQDVAMNHNWIIAASDDADVLPRVSDYGGPVEEACFLLQNLGIAAIVGEKHLVCLDEPSMDDPMPRGKMELRLPDGGILKVGIDAGDELLVQLWRDDALVRERHGMSQVGGNTPINVGNAVGGILSVLALEAWAKPKAKAKKLARAA